MGFNRRIRFIVYFATLALLAGTVVVRKKLSFNRPPSERQPSQSKNPISAQENLKAFYAIEAKALELDKTVWTDEVLAQGYEKFFIRFWDQLNKTTNSLQVLEAAQFQIVRMPSSRTEPIKLPFDILSFELAGSDQLFSKSEFLRSLKPWFEKGIRLSQSEWRHVGFSPPTQGRPARSVIEFTLHLQNVTEMKKWTIQGKLEATWDAISAGGDVQASEIVIRQCTVSERAGPDLFSKVFETAIQPEDKMVFIDPLMIYDLDKDGFSEIFMGCKKVVFWNKHNPSTDAEFTRNFVQENLGLNGAGEIFATALSDLTGDGQPDFICADRDGLLLYAGKAGGFTNTPVRCWKSRVPIRYAQVIVLGDVNNDGRLDVWLAQYKPPFAFGQMPAPFYDANDGFPSFLLLNEGSGQLSDQTKDSGLEHKSFRRTYSASFVDMNQDGRLDLVMNSDFAGADLFLNLGGGKFKDATESAFKNRALLGMAHIVSDFNQDGWLDLFAIGMNSPTVDRLASMNMVRPGFESYLQKQKDLTEGNRLWFWEPGYESKSADTTLFREQKITDDLRRTGWSWGAASFDLENDGDTDVYVVNGHSSYQTVQDYETKFWTHDIYVGNSEHSPARDIYFKSVSSKTRGAGQSYGGFEKNRLVLQHQGRWIEIGWLAGLALEADCRNLVAEDFDGDGRLDMAFTTYEVWPERKQTLKIFQNRIPDTGRWIRFQIHENSECPVIGTQLILKQGKRIERRAVLNGDSHRSQSSFSIHFGLGQSSEPVKVEVLWPNGTRLNLEPAVGKSHFLRAGQAGQAVHE